MSQFKSLSTPLQLRNKALHNRAVFGSHTANIAEDGLPGERHSGYCEERARHGDLMPSQFDITHAADFLTARGLGDGPYQIKKLAGGYWNDVLKVSNPSGTYVVKCYRAVLKDSLFPNLPDAEAAALQRLSGLNVAPEPLAFWPDDGILVYGYVEGEGWQDDLIGMANLLRRKEAADPHGFRVVPITAEGILTEGDALFARCTMDKLYSAFQRGRPSPLATPTPERLSLIHTDIGATNLIGHGEDLRLVDWQCPAMGDLAEDVYSFLSPAFQILNLCQPLSEAARRQFFDALDMPRVKQRYHTLEQSFAYRMAGYCCLRYQTVGDSDIAVRDRYIRAAEAELERING
ncbi:MAG: phosphotransferase [Beijerinckiaceae bacterium]|nr:phosphotransferase [Beijerinckiaceae bacterium]